MAQNLRAKIPETDTLVIHDHNRAVVQKFKEEVGMAAAGAGAEGKGKGIVIAESPREVAERSVRVFPRFPNAISATPMMSMFHTNDLSWELCLWRGSCPDSILTSKPIL